MLEYRKHIGFYNKRIIPYIFYMHIDKNNKVMKTIRGKHGSRDPNITKY
jgi:hypothetical protein